MVTGTSILDQKGCAAKQGILFWFSIGCSFLDEMMPVYQNLYSISYLTYPKHGLLDAFSFDLTGYTQTEFIFWPFSLLVGVDRSMDTEKSTILVKGQSFYGRDVLPDAYPSSFF